MLAKDKNIYTIGHSNHAIEKFLDLVKRYQIEMVVDTRSKPHSRFNPQFNRRALEASLAEQGVRYEYMGEGLGGRPSEPEFYDTQGYVLYGEVARSERFRLATDRLKEMAGSLRIALLCSEENPSVCHRRLLVGRVLFEEGLSVLHIRGDGRLQTEEEMRKEESMSDQPALFEHDDNDWKSPRPITR